MSRHRRFLSHFGSIAMLAGLATAPLAAADLAVAIGHAETAALDAIATTSTLPQSIVGTWYVTVPAGPGPEDDFQALQTFHAHGTFTETSSLLSGLIEGPAHGVWRKHGSGYDLTFQVLTFEGGVGSLPTGRVQVRCRIVLTDDDHFEAQSEVDVLLPDGTVIPEVASGPFTGVRMQLETL